MKSLYVNTGVRLYTSYSPLPPRWLYIGSKPDQTPTLDQNFEKLRIVGRTGNILALTLDWNFEKPGCVPDRKHSGPITDQRNLDRTGIVKNSGPGRFRSHTWPDKLELYQYILFFKLFFSSQTCLHYFYFRPNLECIMIWYHVDIECESWVMN